MSQDTMTPAERYRRRDRSLRRILKLPQHARMDDVRARFAVADAETKRRALAFMPGAPGRPPRVGRIVAQAGIIAGTPVDRRRRRMVPKARYRPDPEEFRAALAKRDAYLRSVGGMWPNRSLKREAVAPAALAKVSPAVIRRTGRGPYRSV